MKFFLYTFLFIFFLEVAIYVGKTIFDPSLIFAQTNEATQSSLLSSPTPIPNVPKLPILIYHYVEYVTDERDTIRQSLNINPNVFESQIKTLKDAGYTFITPTDISKAEKGEIEKPVILSFDDGYRDFYTDVLPILKRNNVRAVAYIVPGYIDKLNYMRWDELKEVSESGLVEIGAHTMHHASLNRLNDQLSSKEIGDSKLVLELSLGKKINAFAYPYGHFNSQTPSIVRSVGFTSAVTTEEGTNINLEDKYLLKRIHPGGNSGDYLLSKL